jgi:hypothetical protein
MAAPFSITTPATTIALEQNRVGYVSYTVTNTTQAPLRARVRPVPVRDAPSEWFIVEGDTERDFAPRSAHQFVVRVEPPLGASAGDYSFRLDVIGIERPDEDHAQGPAVQVTVPASTADIRVPRGYLATLAGAMTGGILGEIVIVIMILTRDRADPDCGDDVAGCIFATAIAELLVLAFLVLLGCILMVIGASIGAAVALRIKRYLGAKLTGLFLGVLMVGWTFLMGLTVFRFVESPVLAAVLAPILLVAVPAVLGRAGVLLIRTRHI